MAKELQDLRDATESSHRVAVDAQAAWGQVATEQIALLSRYEPHILLMRLASACSDVDRDSLEIAHQFVDAARPATDIEITAFVQQFKAARRVFHRRQNVLENPRVDWTG